MGQDHYFDIVSRIDLQEVANAVNVALKEIRNRFDFKNSRADILLEKDKLTLVADDDFKVRGLKQVLEEKLVKRKVSLKALDYGRVEDAANRTVRQVVTFQAGIPIEKAREIVKLVKGEKFKAQVAIQGDEVRVSSPKIDVLQEIIAFLKVPGPRNPYAVHEFPMTPFDAGRPGPEAGRSAALLAEIFGEIRDGMDEVEGNIRSWAASPNPLIAELGTYLFQEKGKRLRPALLLLSAKVSGYAGPEAPLLAAVVEIIHTASLIHDDIVDNAGTRRGRPTVHSVWGPNVTVLLGDYLFIKSIGLALRSGDDRIIRILADLSARMIEGELTEYAHGGDLGIPESRYFEIIDMKTASLFTAAARIGGHPGQDPGRGRIRPGGGRPEPGNGLPDRRRPPRLRRGRGGHRQARPLGPGRGPDHPAADPRPQRRGRRSAGRLAGMVGRKDLDATARDEVLTILRGSGSLEYAYGRARAHVDDARVLLGRFPESPGRRALFRFADLVLERER